MHERNLYFVPGVGVEMLAPNGENGSVGFGAGLATERSRGSDRLADARI